MLSEEQMKELLQQLAQVREYLRQLSFHVVEMLQTVDELLERMEKMAAKEVSGR